MYEPSLYNQSEAITPDNYYPNFTSVGYEVIQELRRNQEGGRVTYLAKDLQSQRQVVIKEFCFASMITDWSDIKAHEREMQLLQKLQHSRIPRYLDSFELPGFFYLVLEYKNAPCLCSQNSFNPQEIKQIASSILEILVDLQQQVSPVIHRDIKPENILVDEQLNTYLIDFGLARFQNEKTYLSTLVAGTPGFIPPEEYFGHSLTQTSDLYSLGVTIICLLSHIHPRDIENLIDDNYRFNFQHLVPDISPQFRSWLMRMVEPHRHRRYVNARTALKILKSIPPTSPLPKVENLYIIK
jgi:serine/threonine protein kinase